MGWIIGIDDAGRGPVLGPMILAGVLMDENEQIELQNLGAKDSKLLTPEKRRVIGDKLVKRFEHHIEIASPREIDDSENLNYLEAVKSAMIVNKLMEKTTGKVKVVIDCPSVNIEKWSEDVSKLIKRKFKKNVNLVCEHKADATNLTVAAGSIIAKETREEEVFKMKLAIKEDVGSGYPSDPKTKDFIKDNYSNPKYKQYIRFSWKTVKNLVKEAGQKKLF